MALLRFYSDVNPVLPDTLSNNQASAETPLRLTVVRDLNKDLLQRVVQLVLDTNADIVLSSTWRGSLELKLKFYNSLMEAGMPEACIVGQTP